MSDHMRLYEIFLRSKRGLDHKHVGSLHAEDPQQALEYARDIYTRRSEGVSIWVVNSSDIVASQEDDCDALEPGSYRWWVQPRNADGVGRTPPAHDAACC